jgi:Flp pilus assembly protein TadD
MARGAAQTRRKRPKPEPRRSRPRSSTPTVAAQTMFFPRLRRQAKWVFVFLAVVFAAGFVFFGVGSGSTGIGDILRGNFNIFGTGNSTSSPSISSAQKRIAKNPKDAAAWRKLATAYEQKQSDANAINALTHYTKLRPRDVDALSELAGLQLKRAGDLQNAYQQAQSEAATSAPLPLPLDQNSPLGKALAQDPITTAANEAVNTKFQQLAVAMNNAKTTYQKLARAKPNEPTTQLLLGQIAEQTGDSKTALAAYKRFVKLAPDDASAPYAKGRIAQLQRQPGQAPRR